MNRNSDLHHVGTTAFFSAKANTVYPGNMKNLLYAGEAEEIQADLPLAAINFFLPGEENVGSRSLSAMAGF